MHITVFRRNQVLNMPRNAKSRRVCAEFETKVFTPKEFETTPVKQNEHSIELYRNEIDLQKVPYVTMNVEELEVLRLCDLEGFEQEQAAKQMQISRGTLQRILYSARQKSAKALCEGQGVVVTGGNYQISKQRCECEKQCKNCKQFQS